MVCNQDRFFLLEVLIQDVSLFRQRRQPIDGRLFFALAIQAVAMDCAVLAADGEVAHHFGLGAKLSGWLSAVDPDVFCQNRHIANLF